MLSIQDVFVILAARTNKIKMATKKNLMRSNNRMIAGVCSGIADYFEWDITLVRIGYVVLTCLTAVGGGAILYLILWLCMPETKSNGNAE